MFTGTQRIHRPSAIRTAELLCPTGIGWVSPKERQMLLKTFSLGLHQERNWRFRLPTSLARGQEQIQINWIKEKQPVDCGSDELYPSSENKSWLTCPNSAERIFWIRDSIKIEREHLFADAIPACCVVVPVRYRAEAPWKGTGPWANFSVLNWTWLDKPKDLRSG